MSAPPVATAEGRYLGQVEIRDAPTMTQLQSMLISNHIAQRANGWTKVLRLPTEVMSSTSANNYYTPTFSPMTHGPYVSVMIHAIAKLVSDSTAQAPYTIRAYIDFHSSANALYNDNLATGSTFDGWYHSGQTISISIGFGQQEQGSSTIFTFLSAAPACRLRFDNSDTTIKFEARVAVAMHS